MDLTLTPEEEQFRTELRSWLEKNHPGPEPEGAEESFQFRRAWQHRMQEDRWAGLTWPVAYGGRGATLMQSAIFNEEMVRARVPAPANILGLVMGGPVVIAHGTDMQKERFLQPILAADEIWCQGFSEPDAGSDLASLKTRAVKVDGGWRINGQKVWTSFAHQAKWCMLLARTDPEAKKHAGITYFLMDMHQEGVQARPLRQLTNESEFNEVFIDDAFVPDENVVGQPGDGWGVAITTLALERAGLSLGSAIAIQIQLRELAAMIRELDKDRDAAVRQKFGELCVKAETMRLNGARGLSQVIQHGVPGPEGSLVKIQWAEINQAMTEFAVQVRGNQGLVDDTPWSYRMFRARGNSIEGGTSEIQKNILAERVLMLPRLR
ncbi:MAG: acyl-CoA dehydrogenase family protein [Candidatus Dormibacteria bacterium]